MIRLVHLAGCAALAVLMAALSALATEQEPSSDKWDKIFGDTLRRHFESVTDFHPDDLISRSLVEDFHRYLRRTSSAYTAQVAKVLPKVLPDQSRLVQHFYVRNGAKVLRGAAAELGGYEPLDMLTRDAEGLLAIREALASEDATLLVDLVNSRAQSSAADQVKDEQGHVNQELTEEKFRIYTLEELLQAVLADGS